MNANIHKAYSKILILYVIPTGQSSFIQHTRICKVVVPHTLNCCKSRLLSPPLQLSCTSIVFPFCSSVCSWSGWKPVTLNAIGSVGSEYKDKQEVNELMSFRLIGLISSYFRCWHTNKHLSGHTIKSVMWCNVTSLWGESISTDFVT